jgi:hypothetical protein
MVLVIGDFAEGHKALANIKKHHVNICITLLRTLRIHNLSKWRSGMVIWCCRKCVDYVCMYVMLQDQVCPFTTRILYLIVFGLFAWIYADYGSLFLFV